MHAPYIKKIFGDHEFKLVPIVVGSINFDQEQEFGEILAPYFKDEENLFVISSDFCHWGSNFDYMPMSDDKKVGIPEFIESMDKEGIEHICNQDGEKFSQYLKKTENTICGRHPIGVLLATIANSGV